VRPRSIAEVARLVAAGDSFDRCLANFLDEFRAAPSEAMLAEEPQRLAAAENELGATQDAYLAAAVEELAREMTLTCPSWTSDPTRALRQPWFASNMASLRAVLLHESPASFRARNLFVSRNALSRA
jgi:hypothetical protein